MQPPESFLESLEAYLLEDESTQKRVSCKSWDPGAALMMLGRGRGEGVSKGTGRMLGAGLSGVREGEEGLSEGWRFSAG